MEKILRHIQIMEVVASRFATAGLSQMVEAL
jgi:hypothetical protein